MFISNLLYDKNKLSIKPICYNENFKNIDNEFRMACNLLRYKIENEEAFFHYLLITEEE